MDPAKLPNAALYYPFINFRKQDWLKRAVLHWDVIWRIAPDGHEALDPPRYWSSQPKDIEVLEDEGIVRRLRPGLAEEEVGTVWERFLQKNGDALAKKFAVDLDRREVLTDVSQETRGFLSSPLRRLRGVGWMFNPKMQPPLLDRLADLGLVVRGRERGVPNWSAMDERLLDAYMTTLANQIVADRQVETVADSPAYFRRFEENSVAALRELLLPRHRPSPSKDLKRASDGPEMMALAIESVQPGGIDTMSLSDVLAVRKTSSDARRAFKQAVHGMVDELRTLRGNALDRKPPTTNDLADLRRRHVDEPLEELRSAMRWNKVDTVKSVVTLRYALEGGTLGALLLGPAGAAALGVAGLALAGLTTWRAASVRKKEARKSPLAWLLDVEKTLDARDALARVS